MSELITSLNIWAILVATIGYFFLGFIWYSMLFTKQWMVLRGVTEEDIGEPNPLIFLWSFLLQLVAVVSLSTFMAAMMIESAIDGILIGFGAGAGLVFTLTGTTGLFSDTKPALHFIDNGYHVVGLTIAGAILGAW